ncbi:MAG: hypothetical protein WCT04_14600 [Planctomycetota bacterium]
MKPIPTLFLVLCVHHASLVQSHATDAPTSKPNILIILSDDQGYANMSFQGSKDVPTPHLDGLIAGKTGTSSLPPMTSSGAWIGAAPA